ncbi:NAD(P)-dependent oxidoreductase [Pyxidicoccus xibeiensis]|uniref:NAD(P)-dependent oxidoreductase n=1 Tax=Pyxidicoccus xibeiensis TaxID=2906759 RepID=UPI0020A7A31E|nr:NAD(P)H-binding protein [Pyxidicoccus xibeiensis]MCP3142822.1 NAD(P)H-binding protein [Pyxidicoccus xibeiensis]
MLSGLACMTLRLLVLGATGKTGTHILDLALARGHQVTAFVRSPQKIVRRHPALSIVQGDPMQVNALAQALPGHHAVLSALGPSGREAFQPNSLLAECAASTVAAMERASVTRLAMVSAALLFPGGGLRFALFRRLIRHHLRDLVAAEAVIRATPFDWTLARPPRLVEAPEETYRSEREALPTGAWSMSFRAVGAFLLDCIEQGAHTREVVGLARR